MLLKQTQLKVIFFSTLFGLSVLLNACGNSQQLENFLSADPNLESNKQQDDISQNRANNAQAAEEQNQSPIQLTKSPKEKTTNSDNSSTVATEKTVTDLPESIPFYPQATLEVIAPQSTPEKGVSEWRSRDTIDTIVNYYQEKWQEEDWQVIQPFESNAENNPTAIVSKDNLDYTILLASASDTGEDRAEETQLKIMYQAANSPTSAIEETTEEQITAGVDNDVAPTEDRNLDTQDSISQDREQQNTITSPETNTQINNQPLSFGDFTETPEQLRQYVQDLANLGIINPKTKDATTNTPQFKPNEPITRREYAKWLVATNNKYYANSPEEQIRLANKSSNAAFKDIGTNDPDFAEIQGLAETGLIPSPLTNDSNNILFKPDAPLTREDLIIWKVPLDVRSDLSPTTSTAIQEAWGFKDANKIDPAALPALFADYQNSDRSNVKRIFGYTTLFQPKKAVTRAEAAASLWYFGFQGEGITAQETLSIIE